MYSSKQASQGGSRDKEDVVVDLRSDTITKPGPAMRAAMAAAEVGDDVFRDDPTVLALEARVAAMAGKEAALFVPSGTMGNLICVLSHCWGRGAEVLLGDMSHIYIYEQGGVAQLGGVHTRALTNRKDGTFSLKELEAKVREDDVHLPVTTLVAIENTHNKCGGCTLPREWIKDLVNTCRRLNLPVHCDGARLMNASVSQGVPIKELLEGIDSASICLSKGLGAPVGSVIVGTKAFMEKAIRLRKVLGGGMRQCGIVAAAGLWSLDNMMGQLSVDHSHARSLAEVVNKAGQGKVLVEDVQSNIVIMRVEEEVASGMEVVERLGEVGVRTLEFAKDKVRFVFHGDISEDMANIANQKVEEVIKQIIKEK